MIGPNVDALEIGIVLGKDTDVELVDPLVIENDRTVLAVDLEAEEILASWCETRGLYRTDRAIAELEHAHDFVVDIDARASRTVWRGTFCNPGP